MQRRPSGVQASEFTEVRIYEIHMHEQQRVAAHVLIIAESAVSMTAKRLLLQLKLHIASTFVGMT